MSSTRREILTALLGLPAALAACKKTKTAAFDGSFVDDVMTDGHRLRDGLLPNARQEPESIPVLILGGGIAGLTAGWRLMQAGFDRFRLLEMGHVPGGTAASGRSAVTAYPWAGHYVPVPQASNPELVTLFEETGTRIKEENRYRETQLCASPKERLYYAGLWREGIYPEDGASKEDLEQVGRWERAVHRFAGAAVEGRRAFTFPLVNCSDAADYRALDSMSMAEWLDKNAFDSPRLRWFVEYACRDDYGAQLAETSAWFGLHYYASRIAKAGGGSAPSLTWPAGNGFIVNHFVERIGAQRIQLGNLIVTVAPHKDGRRARVVAFDRRQKRSKSYIAEQVIFALPSYLRSRVIVGFEPVRYDPPYSPWIVANVHLRSRPDYFGFETAWDNVIYDSRSLGYVVATHQGGPSRGPTVWTYYLPFTGAEPKKDRERLLSLSYDDIARTIYAELSRCHVELEKHVERIDIRRWGHAMVRPVMGTAFDPARKLASSPFGPIHFAHTDLSGVALFEEAFFHGLRAANEVLQAMR